MRMHFELLNRWLAFVVCNIGHLNLIQHSLDKLDTFAKPQIMRLHTDNYDINSEACVISVARCRTDGDVRWPCIHDRLQVSVILHRLNIHWTSECASHARDGLLFPHENAATAEQICKFPTRTAVTRTYSAMWHTQFTRLSMQIPQISRGCHLVNWYVWQVMVVQNPLGRQNVDSNVSYYQTYHIAFNESILYCAMPLEMRCWPLWPSKFTS